MCPEAEVTDTYEDTTSVKQAIAGKKFAMWNGLQLGFPFSHCFL